MIRPTGALQKRRVILERFSFFRSGTPRFQDELLAAAIFKEIPAGTCLFQPGESCAGVPFLGRGRVVVTMSSRAGRGLALYSVEPGETCILSLLCALRHEPYVVTGVAAATSTAVMLPAGVVPRWMETEGAFRAFVFDTLARRIYALMGLVGQVAFHTTRARLARHLLETHGAQAAAITHETHGEIAARLGSAREVVSRLLREFEDRGAIERGRRHIQVVDAAQLRRYAAGDPVRGNGPDHPTPPGSPGRRPSR